MSREKQIEEMARAICNHHGTSFCKSNCDKYKYCDCKIDAEHLYNAGYRKQSEGEWKYPPYAPYGGSYEMRRCSVCGYKPDFDSDNPYTKFCPNCGARMKGERND